MKVAPLKKNLNNLTGKVLITLLFFSWSVNAQKKEPVFKQYEFKSPYEFSWKKETPIVGISLISYGVGSILSRNMTSLSTEEILSLDRSNISRFDRNATFKYSTRAAAGSDFLLASSYILPGLFLLEEDSKKAFGHIIILVQEVTLLTQGLTYMTKRSVKRARPLVYNELVDLQEKQRKSSRYSFFSGHTSVTTANYFLFAKIYSDFYPDSKLKPYIWTTAALVPAVTGWLRVEAGKHFYSDVITGYAVGALIGYMVPQLHKNKSSSQSLSFYPTATGIGMRWQIGQTKRR